MFDSLIQKRKPAIAEMPGIKRRKEIAGKPIKVPATLRMHGHLQKWGSQQHAGRLITAETSVITEEMTGAAVTGPMKQWESQQ